MYLLLCLPDHKDHILRILIHNESFLHRVTFCKYLVRAARKTTNTIPLSIPVLCPLRGQQLLSLLPCSGNGDALYSRILRKNTLREWNPLLHTLPSLHHLGCSIFLWVLSISQMPLHSPDLCSQTLDGCGLRTGSTQILALLNGSVSLGLVVNLSETYWSLCSLSRDNSS